MNHILAFGVMLAVLIAPVSALAAPDEAVGDETVVAVEEQGDVLDQLLAALTADPEGADAAIQVAVLAAPDRVGEIVATAVDAGVDPALAVSAAVTVFLEGAGPAVTAAVAARPAMEQDIVAAAIMAGADPTVVTSASAAGKAPPSPFAPAVLPNVGIGRGGVTPYGVGVVMGGLAASPS